METIYRRFLVYFFLSVLLVSDLTVKKSYFIVDIGYGYIDYVIFYFSMYDFSLAHMLIHPYDEDFFTLLFFFLTEIFLFVPT